MWGGSRRGRRTDIRGADRGDAKQDYRDTDPEGTEMSKVLDTLDGLLDDSESKQALLEKVSEP